ncbi:unnamed protein product [Diabrotica balteata]|uniref:Uncharacterized protein n=1 Tax=Diabrotica balteata TaxID=107213 RepID=A0A9N9T2A6_DIABA|nr:unnamed protein product [Diabrotica balteata]
MCVCFGIVYTLSSWKAWLVRRKPIRKLMHEIVIFENNLKQEKDQQFYQIYVEESRNSFKLGILLPIACLACGVNEVTTFIINFMDWKEKEAKGLETGRSLIFPEWFPYYNDNYFNAYYFYQVAAVFFCDQYISCSDAPIVSLIMFASVRFRVLGRRIETFFKNGETDPIKNMKRLRKLILEHKDIIRLVVFPL